MRNFDLEGWEVWTEGFSAGSGRSEKEWIHNLGTGEIGLFKFPKSNQTKEHVSEKIAFEIANLLMLESAKVEIGIYDNRIGSFSYLINKDERENLVEGINLITRLYRAYDRNRLYDEEKNRYYCIEMIKESLDEKIFDEFLKIMIFDFLIGNTDRHHSNWAIIKEEKQERLSPIYDNGSSLACYIKEEDIPAYLDKRQNRFLALVDTKSRSRIRVNGDLKKEPTHREVIEHLSVRYKEKIYDIVNRIMQIVTEEEINRILSDVQEDLLSQKRKELIIQFLMAKKQILYDIYYKS